MNGKQFDYGDFFIEYRPNRNGVLLFLKKKLNDIDSAMKEADILKNKGYNDVMIRRKEK